MLTERGTQDLKEIPSKYENLDIFVPPNYGSLIPYSNIIKGILLPKYYNLGIEEKLEKLSENHTSASIGQLVEQNIIAWKTGIKVEKCIWNR